jgi:hypothetical protein
MELKWSLMSASNVSAPPVFMYDESKFKDKIILKAGTSTAWEIPFAACPQPKVKWAVNGDPIPMTSRFVVDVIYNMTSLCIGRAEPKDSGNYTLTLENQHGKCTLSIKLIVIGESPC